MQRHIYSLLFACVFSVQAYPQQTAVLGDADYPQPTPSARHSQKVNEVRNGDYEIALIGDSIIHSLGELDGKYLPLRDVWKTYFAPLKAINLGHNGYRTEQILWNLQNGELDFQRSPSVFLLSIGTNNTDDRHFKTVHTAEEVFQGTEAIVNFIRECHPTSKILVLRIFPRGGDDQTGVSPPDFNSSPQCIRTCMKAGELTKRLADGKSVFWLDINHVFLQENGRINTDLMWDLLHPSPAGAEAWSKAVLPTIRRLMSTEVEATTWVPPESLAALPSIPELPDLMTFADGSVVKSKEDWLRRREELKAMLLYYQYGRIPARPDQVTIVESRRESHESGLGTLDFLTLEIGSYRKLRFRTAFYVPDQKRFPGRRPVIIREEGRIGHQRDVAMFLEKGYLFVEYARHDLDPDRDRVVGAAQAAYPNHDWATLSVWAWCGMRLVDYLESRDDVDMSRIGITGHSRGGKMALLTAALDERISLVVPHQSGSGGAGSYRILSPGAETLSHNDKPHWYHERLRWFWEMEDRLPFDQHSLKALVAPRALLCTESYDDEFANPLGSLATSVAAQQVFDFLGATEKNAIHFRGGRHSTNKEDWQRILEFAEWHFSGKPPKDRDAYWQETWPLPVNYQRNLERKLVPPVISEDSGDFALPNESKTKYQFTTVGEPGNRPDVNHHGQGRYGAVSDKFHIARRQVSQMDYARFLNSVARQEQGGLYHARMGTGPGAIRRDGTAGSYRYLLRVDEPPTPVAHVSWFDAVRYCNWLHHGQRDDPTLLLSGAYDLTSIPVTRSKEAKFFLPSEDEWYKSAYYVGQEHRSGGVRYNHFASGESNRPIITKPDAALESPWGMQGYADPIWEWTDTRVGRLHRSIRSAAWFLGNNKQAAGHFYSNAEIEYPSIGFRVAAPAL